MWSTAYHEVLYLRRAIPRDYLNIIHCAPAVIGGPSLLLLHTLRHGVAEGVLKAVGEHPEVLGGESADWDGASYQQVREIKER